MTTEAPTKPQLSPGMKLTLDLGPLMVFVLGYFRPHWFAPLLSRLLPEPLLAGEHAGIFTATALFIPAILAALAVSYSLTRHLPVMPVVTAIIVIVFGGMTLALQDETFIKMKPTIVYVLFAATLIGGLAFKKPLLGMVFDSVFNLTDEGWRKLTLRWGLFFLAMAILNETGLAHPDDDVLGQLQGVRLPPDHIYLRGAAIPAAAKVCGAGNIEESVGWAKLVPRKRGKRAHGVKRCRAMVTWARRASAVPLPTLRATIVVPPAPSRSAASPSFPGSAP